MGLFSFKKTFGGDDVDKRDDGVSIGGFNLSAIGNMKTVFDARKNGKEDFNIEMFTNDFWNPYTAQNNIVAEGDEIGEFSRAYYLDFPNILTTADFIAMLKQDNAFVERVFERIRAVRRKEDDERWEQRKA